MISIYDRDNQIREVKVSHAKHLNAQFIVEDHHKYHVKRISEPHSNSQ